MRERIQDRYYLGHALGFKFKRTICFRQLTLFWGVAFWGHLSARTVLSPNNYTTAETLHRVGGGKAVLRHAYVTRTKVRFWV